jgi:hypothetical protein
MFDWITDGISWVGDQVSSLFGGAEEIISDGGYEVAWGAADTPTSGADWLGNVFGSDGAKAAFKGGASALLSRRQPSGGGVGGTQMASRLSANTAADRLPVQAMGDAKGPRAIVSEEPNTLDAYWADRMRVFGRLNDTTSSTKAGR